MREFTVLMAGARLREERAHDARAWLAWHAGVLSQSKPPPLEHLTIAGQRRRKFQTSKDHYRIMRQMFPDNGPL